jgi:hypothetical protein
MSYLILPLCTRVAPPLSPPNDGPATQPNIHLRESLVHVSTLRIFVSNPCLARLRVSRGEVPSHMLKDIKINNKYKVVMMSFG